MGMATEALDGNIRMHFPNGAEDCTESAARHGRADWVVTNDNKEVDRLGVVEGVLEPRLLDHICRFNHLGNVAVTSEVEEYSKGHDSESCKKVSDAYRNLQLAYLALL